jgi:hypothetical protein
VLSSAPGVDEVRVPDEGSSGAEWHAPLASLPHVFRSTTDTIPATVPYVSVNSQRAGEWRVITTRFKVGLVWAGNRSHTNDRNRSIPSHLFETLTGVGGSVAISLQKPPDLRLRGAVHLGAALGDLSDTAAVISQLDLIISVDTVVAHLAGALGKPVWTLLPFAPDWRWMWTREDTPWYPTMRLFRQPKQGDWESVIERVRAELERTVINHQPE